MAPPLLSRLTLVVMLAPSPMFQFPEPEIVPFFRSSVPLSPILAVRNVRLLVLSVLPLPE